MVKKICPICGQVMKSGHFCWGCRTWVRRPYEQDVNYYLNERHPGYEFRRDCQDVKKPRSAGAASSADIYADQELNRLLRSHSSGSDGRQPGAAGKRPSGAAAGRPSGTGGAGNGPRVTAELVKSRKGIYIVAAAALGIVLLIGVWSLVIGGLRNAASNQYSNDWFSEDAPPDLDEWFDGHYRELEDDEVKAAGVHCNAFYHFAAKEEALAPAVSDAILSAGYQIASEADYSFNEAVLNGEDEWTYYSTNHTIYVSENDMTIRDDLSQWVELNSDTATGELHTYASQLADQTKSLMIMAEFVKGIESGYGIGPEESCIPRITQDMQPELDASGSYIYESDLFYITAQMYPDGVHLEVSCNQED